MRYGFSLICVLIFGSLLGQEITYYDMYENKVDSEDRAFYYRIRKEPKKRQSTGLIKVQEFYVMNKQLKKDANYLVIAPDLLTGDYEEYFITGQVKARGKYDKGNKKAGFETYHYNGQLASLLSQDERKLYITSYNHTGELIDKELFFDNVVYTKVEVNPKFLGGQDNFRDFLYENLTYPATASSKKVEGSVYVQFVVDYDGSLSDIEVIKGIGAGCDEEALRVIEMTDKMWTPGKQEDKIVKTKMVVPITFRLAH